MDQGETAAAVGLLQPEWNLFVSYSFRLLLVAAVAAASKLQHWQIMRPGLLLCSPAAKTATVAAVTT